MGATHIEKKCGACKVVKSVDEFYRNGTRGRDGFCKTCRRIKDRERSERAVANRVKIAKVDPLFFRRRKLIKMYGITHEQWLDMYHMQGGVCKICGHPEKRVLYGQVSHLVVDHDHVTGKVRALLCASCNGGISRFENYDFSHKAFSYLVKMGSMSHERVKDLIAHLHVMLGHESEMS